jgi:hypothetical protein
MSATTPVYGWPYQTRFDAPDGPILGANLALAVEASLRGVDLRLAAVEPVAPLLTRMGCTLRRVANQTLADITTTAVNWDTEDVDTNGMIAAPGTTLTIPTGGGGIWAVSFLVVQAAAATGRSFGQITTSIPPWNIGGALRFAYAAGEAFVAGSAVFPAAAGNTFSIEVNSDTAAGTTMTAALTAYRVGL